MTRVVIQMGHVPRTRGATGTHREQEFTRACGELLARALDDAPGFDPVLIGADVTVPRSDIFVALHTDGSTNPARRGASVGYPDQRGAALALLWKAEHQAGGYPGGFLRDNYTDALRYYYGFRRSAAPVRFLAEHGTTTNRDDEAWLFGNLDACVQAHVRALHRFTGRPFGPQPVTPSEPGRISTVDMPVLKRGGTAFFHNTVWQGVLRGQLLLEPSGIDGQFGPATEAATKELQRRRGLPTTGVVDRATWDEGLQWKGAGK